MLHAIDQNKAGRNFSEKETNWRALFKGSEDSLTSSVFGLLRYLPVELFWQLLKEACYQDEFPKYCGSIEGFEFWSHWDSTDTSNSNFVEPDVFIRFAALDLIVEAKRWDDKQQNSDQWKNELQGYYNEHNAEKGFPKPVFLLALGGLHSIQNESIVLDNGLLEARVIKCRWLGLLKAIQTMQKRLEHSKELLSSVQSVLHILEDLVLAFRLHDYFTGHWLEEMPTTYSIRASSIDWFLETDSPKHSTTIDWLSNISPNYKINNSSIDHLLNSTF